MSPGEECVVYVCLRYRFNFKALKQKVIVGKRYVFYIYFLLNFLLSIHHTFTNDKVESTHNHR